MIPVSRVGRTATSALLRPSLTCLSVRRTLAVLPRPASRPAWPSFPSQPWHDSAVNDGLRKVAIRHFSSCRRRHEQRTGEDKPGTNISESQPPASDESLATSQDPKVTDETIQKARMEGIAQAQEQLDSEPVPSRTAATPERVRPVDGTPPGSEPPMSGNVVEPDSPIDPIKEAPIANPPQSTAASTRTLAKESESASTINNNNNDELLQHGLPSQTAWNRSVIVARFHEHMEKFLARLAVAGQQLNVYTGTDYSGIDSLRRSIINLEKQMRGRHDAVEAAKYSHSSALSAQSASQKEVVQLLERKHSWSAGDLERYMTLIRSEHLNEQAVQSAREAVSQAERDLEDSRAKLEKYERRQYHEEQIWSDTIRRNSTWVTFALMGFNIFLLLFSLVLIEPWRRRRLVKEVRAALEEKAPTPSPPAETTLAPPAAVAPAATPASAATNLEVQEETALPTIASPQVVQAVDAATPPELESLEQVQATTPATESLPGPADGYLGIETIPLATTDEVPPAVPSAVQEIQPETTPPFVLYSNDWTMTLEIWKAYWADLFSERTIALRKVDLTTATLEAGVAGAACMGLLFVLLRPR